ncbi:MAG: hypothetical protein HZA77_07885 [Candidatus Schekmanbacteria bacterium]|nr:hypothetical protein [Candidatus Schekmanbacteria bacterium]
MTKTNNRLLLIMLLLFLVLRISLILFATDYSNMYEERPLSLLAHDVKDGNIRLPLMAYYYTGGHGGHVVNALLYVPFFILFGDSLFVLKLTVLILFSLPALALWYLFLNKYCGAESAVVFSLLYIMSPPYFSLNNIIGWGLHTEMSFFYILFLFLIGNLIYDSDEEGRANLKPLQTLVCGFIAGLSLFYGYSFAAVLAVSLLSVYLIKRSYHIVKFLVLFFILFPAGLGVLLYKIFIVKRYIVHVQDQPFIPSPEMGRYLQKFKDLVISIPHSFYFRFWDEASIDSNTMSYEYALVFLAAFMAGLFLERKNIYSACRALVPAEKFRLDKKQLTPELLILMSSLSFIMMVLLSAFYIPDFIPGSNILYNKLNFYRYLLPFYPFMFALMAVIFQRLWKSGKRSVKMMALILLVLNLLYCLTSNVRLMDYSSLGTSFINRGYTLHGYESRAVVSTLNKSSSFDDALRGFDRYSDGEKYNVYNFLGKTVGMRNYSLEEVIGAVSKNHGEKLTGVIEGFFEDKGYRFLKEGRDIEEYVRMADSLANEDYQRICFRKLGFVSGSYEKLKKKAGEIILLLPAKYASSFAEGYGESMINETMFHCIITEVYNGQEWVSFPQEYIGDYYYGLGRGLGTSFMGIKNSLYDISEDRPEYRALYYKRLDNYVNDVKKWVSNKGYGVSDKTKIYEGVKDKANEIFFNSQEIKEYIEKEFM